MSGPATLSAGTVFAADYRVVRPLKQGGMGAVYVAEQISTSRPCALKVMLPELVENAELRKRFLREARIGAQLKGDFVVQVIQAGVDDGTGMPWLAMELLEGEDLEAFVARKGRIDAGELLEIFDQMCDALGEAHRAGIVHRDLKPENVFLAKPRRRRDRFTVKVLDFGIARMLAEAQTTSSKTRSPMGTPLFMAPEQAKLDMPITPATDVWALGLMAFRLLTGRHFWRAAYADGATLVMLAMEAYVEPLPAASERAGYWGCEPLPPGFDAWFARCVARDAAARFPDATATFDELTRVLAAFATDRAAAAVGVDSEVPASFLAPTRPQKDVELLALAKTDLPSSDQPLSDPHEPIASSETIPALASEEINPRLLPSAAAKEWAPPEGLPAQWRAGQGAVPARRDRRRLLVVTGSVAVGLVALASLSRAVHSLGNVRLPFGWGDATDCPVGMAKIDGGTFNMGSNASEDEKPPHDVHVRTFCMDRTEVTVDGYATCVEEGKCSPAGTQSELCNAGKPDRQFHAINCVDHGQATAYCAWARTKGRLPSETEWEFAARGVRGRLYPWGDEPPSKQLCWNGDVEWKRNHPDLGVRKGTCPVEEHFEGDTPGTDLSDMAGNVWEWTSSWYCPYGSDQKCAESTRVIRGGGWTDDDPSAVRAANRTGETPSRGDSLVGFRCAQDFP